MRSLASILLQRFTYVINLTLCNQPTIPTYPLSHTDGLLSCLGSDSPEWTLSHQVRADTSMLDCLPSLSGCSSQPSLALISSSELLQLHLPTLSPLIALRLNYLRRGRSITQYLPHNICIILQFFKS